MPQIWKSVRDRRREVTNGNGAQVYAGGKMIAFVGVRAIGRVGGGALLAAMILLGPAPAFAQAGGQPAGNATTPMAMGPIATAPAAARNITIIPQGEMGAGTENRMWAAPAAPFQPKPVPYKINMTEHVKITMRDGVKLDALLYVPVRSKPAGCILIADGYGWSHDPRDQRLAEEDGYAVLNVSYRGIFQSEG